MMKKKILCIRCEIVDRKPKEARHEIINNGIKGYVCDECLKEINEEQEILYEIKENEDSS